MGQSKFIELQVGEPIWMRVAGIFTLTLAGFSLLLTGTSWIWKLPAFIGLFFVWFSIRFQNQRCADIRAVRLYYDGCATLLLEDGTEAPAALRGQAWICRWVAVLSLSRPDRSRQEKLVISRSRNHPQNYRHMAKLARFGVRSGTSDKIMEQP